MEAGRFLALITRNKRDKIALRGVRITSHIIGFTQHTTVRQSFVNLEDRAIEAVYTFPLPDGAAVCGFEVITGDRVLTGEVDDAVSAEDRYDNAISDGDAAFMLEQLRPDAFTINVGNIKPKQAVSIRVQYVADVDVYDSLMRIALPTTIAPRYISHAGSDPLTMGVEGDQLNPPHVLDVPYGMSIEVHLHVGHKIVKIESPTHAIRCLETEPIARVTLEDDIAAMDSDFVLNVGLEAEPKPVVAIGKGPDDGYYAAVSLLPRFDNVPASPATGDREVVFLIDCSGSMDGPSIAQAKTALSCCLRAMMPGTSFNIWRFGSKFERMCDQPCVYADKTLRKALRYVRKIEADLGGTEIRDPLEQILKTKPISSKRRDMIVLTDGQVSNEKAVIELAACHANHNRIFTFGIGPASSAYLVRGLARVTRGASEFIAQDERIEPKVLRTFGRLSSPMVTDVLCDWPGSDSTPADPETPAVFEGDALTLLARISGDLPSCVDVCLTTEGGTQRFVLNVPRPSGSGAHIATLWARRRLAYMESNQSAAEQNWRTNRRTRKQLVDLSKTYGVLCSQTSFVAIEHRSVEDRNEGRPALRTVPIQLARSWGAVCASPSGGLVGALRRGVARSCCRLTVPISRLRDQMGDDAGMLNFLESPCGGGPGDDALMADPIALSILQEQQADGSFASGVWDELFIPRRPAFHALLVETALSLPGADTSVDDETKERIRTTLATVRALERLTGSDKQLANPGIQKAYQYVANTLSVDRKQLETAIRLAEDPGTALVRKLSEQDGR